MTLSKIKVLVVGCGHMGTSHALVYRDSPYFTIAGIVDSVPAGRKQLNRQLGGVPEFDDFTTALQTSRPDAVCICTYPETHAALAIQALEAGCHVFVEKPLAADVATATEIIATAKRTGKKALVGYILHYHPAWKKFIELAHELGKPLVMRMNLNQQSSGREWQTHKHLLQRLSPIVDCGVHYLDVMCQMTGSPPVAVHAFGARLSEEIPAGQCNYAQMQVVFADGSVGWYEAGWGPMVSTNAYFIKDVFGPRGAISILSPTDAASDDIASHTRADQIRIHSGELTPDGLFAQADRILPLNDVPDHMELCKREQTFFAQAIRENIDLGSHLQDALNSLRIALAAEESFRHHRLVTL